MKLLYQFAYFLHCEKVYSYAAAIEIPEIQVFFLLRKLLLNWPGTVQISYYSRAVTP